MNTTHRGSRRGLATAAVVIAIAAGAAAAVAATPRTRDGHPDLSGNWLGPTGTVFRQEFPTTRTADGSINAGLATAADAEKFAARLATSNQTGRAMPGSANPPQYKDPANQAKAAALYENGSKTDRVVSCAQPGLPRVGAPRKILQTAKEVVFLYDDLSGMVWRVVPIDGRGYRDRADPSYYGDSVGHWEGDTLVVEARNFVRDTWFGEYGYIHGERMRVIERLTRKDDTLTYQVTVDDSDYLKTPWIKPVVTLKRTDEPLEEPLECVTPVYAEDAGHHAQRVP